LREVTIAVEGAVVVINDNDGGRGEGGRGEDGAGIDNGLAGLDTGDGLFVIDE
jgi:hypothetical protein